MTDTIALIIGPTLASIALYVWIAASLHAVFRKAGEEGWQAWVPVLNILVLLRLGGFSGWWVLLLLIPLVGAVALAVVVWIACSRINTAFGVGPGMTVLAILLFPVWSSILGWGSARWLGSEQRASGPVRSGPALDLDRRMPAPAYTAPSGTGIPLDAIPPRPTGVPPVPPAVPTAAVPGPALVTRVPTSLATPGDLDDDFDDAAVADYAPRRRADARTGGGPRTYSDDPGAPPASGLRARSALPYTGTLPALGHATPTEGPRRSLSPLPDDSPDDHVGETREAPGTGPGPTAAAAPGRPDPWAPPAAAVGTPRHSPTRDGGFPETSAEVSAVASAPALGAPMAARSSVSARHDEPELPDAQGAFDETIVASRRRTPWMLHPPLGAPIAVTSDVLIVGRRPSSDPAFPHAQLVPVADETRTISKTHARLELDSDHWSITDLDSTNGVVLLHPDGSEVELTSGIPRPVTDTFLLGDAELRLIREPGAQ